MKIGDRFGRTTVIDVVHEVDDTGIALVMIKCDCGVRRQFRANGQRPRYCSQFCSLLKRRPRHNLDCIKTVGRGQYKGRPGVFAVGDCFDTARKANRPTLESFCGEETTRYVVVYPDGARVFAESFLDATILFGDRASAPALGAAA